MNDEGFVPDVLLEARAHARTLCGIIKIQDTEEIVEILALQLEGFVRMAFTNSCITGYVKKLYDRIDELETQIKTKNET